MNKETKYLIEEGSKKEMQTKLNQWRHGYTLNILHFNPMGNGNYALLIERTEK